MSTDLPGWLAAPLAEALRRPAAHAVLVHGPGGVGQFEFAYALASAWLCESPEDLRACGHCTGCRLMQSRTHPDFKLLLPEALREALGFADEETRESDKKAKPSREIKVSAVREAIEWTQKSTSRGRAKVVLIHPAQAMNAIAANALLKTLEEPPAGVRLLLCTTDPELLLPTIRSRCQRWPIALPSQEESLAWLGDQGLAGAEVLLAAAGGRPTDAIGMAADGITAAAWSALPNAVSQGDARALMGWPVPRVVDALQKLCQDAMAQSVGGRPRHFAAVPPGADLSKLQAWGRNLARTARHDEHPWNAGLLTEALVAEGAEAWPRAESGRRVATLRGS